MQAAAVFHVLQLVELVEEILLVLVRRAVCQHVRHQLVIIADALVVFVEEVKERVEVCTVFELELRILDLLAQALHLLRQAAQAV